jgi:hypothetical protein
MKFILRVKCVNHDFSQEIADKQHGGKESDDNIHYLWEDELELTQKITTIKVRNNVSYLLQGQQGRKKFSHEFPSCTIIDCIHEDGTITQFPFTKRLIRDTENKRSKDGLHLWFTVYLKGKFKIVNPFDGAYFAKEEFPFDIEEAKAEEQIDEDDNED